MFYDIFAELCKRKNKSPTGAALELNISRATVNYWKNGKEPNVEAVKKIAAFFNVSTNYLLEIPTQKGAPTMFNFPDKYHLTEEQSLFLAKKKWDENVYCGMQMENRAVTFPQTKTILQGVNVPNVHLDDIQAILNMRDSWKYLLSTVNVPLTLDYICKLNEYIARNEALEWGVLRTGSVGISGTDYIPPIPEYEKAAAELKEILTSDTTATEKALNIFTWGARSQLFWDGNKRTSLVAANKILISAGAGMLTIKESNMSEFNTLLVNFYNTGSAERLKEFLYNNAIEGITL